MRRLFALVLIGCVLGTAAQAGDEGPTKPLTYMRWVDIGVGANVAQMKAADIAKLRRCDNWSMYFVPLPGGIEQIFVVGMTLATQFPKVLVSHLSGETIFILSQQGSTKPSDTLHLSKDGIVLTQFSPPFRPHTYLRCIDKPEKK